MPSFHSIRTHKRFKEHFGLHPIPQARRTRVPNRDLGDKISLLTQITHQLAFLLLFFLFVKWK